MTLLMNALTGVTELFALAGPEILFFSVAIAGMALFSRTAMLGSLLAQLMGPPPLKEKKILEEEQEQEEEEKEEYQQNNSESEKELQKALRDGNHAEAVRIWRERKFVMQAPSSLLLVDVLGALRACGSTVRSFVVELQQAVERNPALCEGEAMECLFLALDTERATGGEQGLLEALFHALNEVNAVSPRLQVVMIERVLGWPDGFNEALEKLMDFPAGTRIPGELGSRLLYSATEQQRLPALVAALADVQIAWPATALEAPMALAEARENAELCVHLHRAAMNLDIPRTSEECKILLTCLETQAPAVMRMVAEDIAQNPNLEINEALGIALLRAGIDDNPGLAARVLGRSA